MDNYKLIAALLQAFFGLYDDARDALLQGVNRVTISLYHFRTVNVSEISLGLWVYICVAG